MEASLSKVWYAIYVEGNSLNMVLLRQVRPDLNVQIAAKQK
ncbi:hypothetical protein [Flavobacterium sp. KJJ]|nr:hypothetical protein [Flavobacterium sp. KJJ]